MLSMPFSVHCARRGNLAAVCAFVLAGVLYLLLVVLPQASNSPVGASYDIYNATMPNQMYLSRALARGFGALWISDQNCGQPFLPVSLLGPFYPLSWLMLLGADRGAMLFLIVTLQFATAGVGAYALCRMSGASTVAAIAGGLTFQLCGTTVSNGLWVPTAVMGPYALMPAAWAALEYLIERPTIQRAALLAILITIQALGGYPQIVLFTYEILGLRLLLALVTLPADMRWKVLGWSLVAMSLPALLAAVYLLPAGEFAAMSIRARHLSAAEFVMFLNETWANFRLDAGTTVVEYVPPYTIVGCMLAACVLGRVRHRPLATFYFAVAVLFAMLPWDTVLREAYLSLPVAGSFRGPMRFLWVSTAALSVAVACGIDIIAGSAGQSRRVRLAIALAAVAGVLVFLAIHDLPLSTAETALATGALAVVAIALGSGRCAPLAAPLLLVLATINLALSHKPFFHLLPDTSELTRRSATYEALRERMTPQDRFVSVGVHLDYSNADKAATIFDLPSISDYEPQTSQRYAELIYYLAAKRKLTSIGDFYFGWVALPGARNLFDLLATRYVLWDPQSEHPLNMNGLVEIGRSEGLILYENPQALARAFFVPTLEIAPDGIETIQRLNDSSFDPTAAALVSEAPADGFVGETPPAEGIARIVSDRSEELTVDVDSIGEGFLFVSDQLYPGWTATVNGAPAPILRANYAFRAVHVPTGASVVVMRYRPWSLIIGAVVSTVAAAGLAVALLVARRRRKSAARAQPRPEAIAAG
ncbi:MAG TPA: YfhO family protein [Candidatus Binatia bacterium]|jgi:hypothetical protein